MPMLQIDPNLPKFSNGSIHSNIKAYNIRLVLTTDERKLVILYVCVTAIKYAGSTSTLALFP